MYREAFPILYVSDMERSLQFYCDLLGFSVSYRWPVEGVSLFAFLKLPPLGLGLATVNETGGRVKLPAERAQFELCVYVDDVDEAASQFLAHGVVQLRPPESHPWGERNVYVADPDGYPIQITAVLKP